MCFFNTVTFYNSNGYTGVVKFTLQVSEIREHDLIQHYIMSQELMIKCNLHNISVHINHHIKIPCFERLSIPVTDLF